MIASLYQSLSAALTMAPVLVAPLATASAFALATPLILD
jgi:hypothetical protein